MVQAFSQQAKKRFRSSLMHNNFLAILLLLQNMMTVFILQCSCDICSQASCYYTSEPGGTFCIHSRYKIHTNGFLKLILFCALQMRTKRVNIKSVSNHFYLFVIKVFIRKLSFLNFSFLNFY